MISLSSQNISEYLTKQGFEISNSKNIQIESKSSKNFNLLVTLPDGLRLLIKQESQNIEGKASGQLYKEWRLYSLIREYPELSEISVLVPKAIFHDGKNSIIGFYYRDDYQDLEDVASEDESVIYNLDIVAQLSIALATIHRKTINQQHYRDFLAQELNDVDTAPNFIRGLKRIRTGIFSQVIAENIKFFKLYQRATQLQQAIQELISSYQQCCLIHNDLKFNNILLHNDYLNKFKGCAETNIISLIDWEKFIWGDPAYDLGQLIASYLNLWLSSIVISSEIDIQTALQLATTPLEKVQPSITKIVTTYWRQFPEITKLYPNFLQRVVQFAGIGLIEKIQIKIHYHEPIGNTGICMLQVAQSLLCHPEISLPVIFGDIETVETGFIVTNFTKND